MPYLGNSPTYQVFPIDTFSGNGSQTTFTLSQNVQGESTILVWVNGLKRFTYEYSVNGSLLTFFSPPSAGAGNIEVYYLNVPQTEYALAQGVTSIGLVTSLSGITVTGSPVTTTGTFSISGTLGVSSGGTGANSYPSNQLLIGMGTAPVGALTSTGTNNQVLTSTGNATPPTWTNAVNSLSFGTTGLTPGTTSTGAITVGGTLAVGSGGTGATTFTQYDVLLGNGTDAITSVGSLGNNNYALTSNGPGQKPSWQAKPSADATWGVGALILCQLNGAGDFNPGTDYTGDITIFGVGGGATSVVINGTFLILGAIAAGSEECLVFRKA